MGLNKNAALERCLPPATPPVPGSGEVAYERNVDDETLGKVRMNAIIAGYKVASALAPTLANSAASIREELHKMAVEVAVKIELYTFKGAE